MLRVVCEGMMSRRLNGTRHPAATHSVKRLLTRSSQHVWQKKCPQLLSCTAFSAGHWQMGHTNSASMAETATLSDSG